MAIYKTSFLIRVSEEQIAKVRTDAEAAGLSISQYARWRLGLERRPKATPKAEAPKQDAQAPAMQDM